MTVLGLSSNYHLQQNFEKQLIHQQQHQQQQQKQLINYQWPSSKTDKKIQILNTMFRDDNNNLCNEYDSKNCDYDLYEAVEDYPRSFLVKKSQKKVERTENEPTCSCRGVVSEIEYY